MHNGRNNTEYKFKIEIVTVPPSIKCRKLIVELVENVTSNLSTTLTAYKSEVEIVSESISFSLEEPLSITV